MNPWIIACIVAGLIAFITLLGILIVKERNKIHHPGEDFVANASLPLNENFLLYMQEYAHDYAKDNSEDFPDEPSKNYLERFFEEHMEDMKSGYIKLSTKSVLIMIGLEEKDLIKEATERYLGKKNET